MKREIGSDRTKPLQSLIGSREKAALADAYVSLKARVRIGAGLMSELNPSTSPPSSCKDLADMRTN
jgi:hypothetical protein